MESTGRDRRAWLVFAGVIALLALHVGLAWQSTLQRTLTVDEIFHVTGGYLYDKFGDYRIHPDNGVLPQRMHALPAVLMGAKPPPMAGNEYWRTSDVNVISYQFFYESGNDHWPLLLAARAMNLLFSIGLGITVFVWARSLAGNGAGFIALGLATLSPTILAHGPLATTDMAAAFSMTASVGAFWWQLRARGWWRVLLSAAAFGLACVTKFSAVLLIPIFLLLIAVHWVTSPREERRAGWTAGSVAAHAVIAWIIIWACFGFRYAAFAPGVPPADHFIRTWEWMMDHVGWQGGVIKHIRDWRLLPEAFLFGYTHTYAGSLVRAAFLAGDYSNTGWWYFFPLAFLWKSTPAELAGVAIAVVFAALRWRTLRPWLVRLAPLLVLAAIYGVIALTSSLNIGQRHLLPMYPALFIVTGVLLVKLPRPVWVGGLFVAAQAYSALNIFPYELAYFNALSGGPAHGWRLLVDSSLDWGQDLGGLKAWLDKNNAGPGAQKVFLSYFGSGEPNYYKLNVTRMLFVNGFKFPMPFFEPAPGIYCISATMLQDVYSPARGPWTLEDEKDYQDLRKFEPQFRQFFEDPTARAHLITLVPAERWQTAWQRYEILLHARLCAYLRARGPDAQIGYSILIFRVTDADLEQALRTPYSGWVKALEAADRRAR
jgi:hypothetical protein